MDSFVITISRQYPIKKCLDAIDRADIPRKELRLLFLLDTQDRELIKFCEDWAEKTTWGKRIFYLTDKEPIEPKVFDGYQEKWDRIIENIKIIRNETKDSEIVFMVEDDTIIPPDAFKKLYNRIKADKKIGCIQGVEAVRSSINDCCCGAWLLKVIKGQVIRKLGLKAKRQGIDQIDGGGYYCWVFRQEAIKNIIFRAKLENGWCGPDVWTWWDIKQQGWKTLIDWSVWCGHMDKDGKIYTPENTRNWLYDFSSGDYLHPRMNFNYDIK